MSSLPLDVVPNGAEKIRALTEISEAGFLLALNTSSTGSEYLQNTLPAKWVNYYQSQELERSDPILTWAKANQGSIRWSEITLRDPHNIMKCVRDFDMEFGISCAHCQEGKRSILVCANKTREFSSEEIHVALRILADFSRYLYGSFNVSGKQLEILRLLADGHTIQDIAKKLGLQKSAVHARLVKSKTILGAATTTAAVAIAVRQKLI